MEVKSDEACAKTIGLRLDEAFVSLFGMSAEAGMECAATYREMRIESAYASLQSPMLIERRERAFAVQTIDVVEILHIGGEVTPSQVAGRPHRLFAAQGFGSVDDAQLWLHPLHGCGCERECALSPAFLISYFQILFSFSENLSSINY